MSTRTSPFSGEQAERFVEHLTCCHRWYKHIPVLEGSEFIIVIDPDAGINYPTEHPRLPFGNTQEGYQKAFGRLNYFYCFGSDDTYHSDCRYSSDLIFESFRRHDIVRRFELHQPCRLFPYIAWEFDDVLSVWSEGIDRIIRGFEHERGGELIRLRDAILQRDGFWRNEMSDAEREQFVDEYEQYDDESLTVNIRQYKRLEDAVLEIQQKLRAGELEKMRQAVKTLHPKP